MKIVIKKIQEEIKDILKYEDFSLQVVSDAVIEVKTNLENEKEILKEKRSLVKICNKHFKDGSLEVHDNKMKEINKQLYCVKRIDQYSFLIKGKNHVEVKAE